MITPLLSSEPSTINPAGIRDDRRNLVAMVLILSDNRASFEREIIKYESNPKIGPDILRNRGLHLDVKLLGHS